MSAVALQPTRKLRQHSLPLPVRFPLLSYTLSSPLPPAQTTSSKLFNLPTSNLRSSGSSSRVEYGDVAGCGAFPYV